MMLNFDTELDRRGTTQIITENEIERVEETQVGKAPQDTHGVAHKMVPEEQWGWREIRDYVVSEIEARTGLFPRTGYKEEAIFKRFVKEWGELAAPIAKFVFEVENGKWGGAPISINRFSKNSDPYFALPISERLASGEIVRDW